MRDACGGGNTDEDTKVEKKEHGGGGGKFGQTSTSNVKDASEYIEKLIASGATKDKVSNEIALALKNGGLSKGEAAKLRMAFTPRGVQY